MDSKTLDQMIGNSRRKALVGGCAIVLAISGQAASASTYYIANNGSDSNAGTLAKPFASFSAATLKMVPGDTLYVRGGLYNLTARQIVRGNGSASSYQNILAYPGETPVFDAAKVGAGNDAFTVQGQYINFGGFEIKNSPKNGLVVWGGQHMTIQNCSLHDCQQSGFLAMYSTNWTVNDITVTGCSVYNTCMMNAPAARGTATSWSSAMSFLLASNIKAKNNVVFNNYGEGIDFNRCQNSTMNHNTIYDNYSVNAYLDNGISCDVSNNLIYSTGNTKFFRNGLAASGIQCAIEPSSYSGAIGLTNCTIQYNYVVNTGSGFCYGNYGLGGGMKNCLVQFNTFYKASGCMLSLAADKGHANNTFTNNIWCQANSGSMVYNGATTGVNFSQNCWYGGLSEKSYAGAGDIKSDPRFYTPGVYNTTGYRLLPGSPCLNKNMGAAVTAISP